MRSRRYTRTRSCDVAGERRARDEFADVVLTHLDGGGLPKAASTFNRECERVSSSRWTIAVSGGMV
jgi:hypothetical protein